MKSTASEPTPPSRKDEDFPKTNTIPDGWVSDVLMDVYNNPATMRGDGPDRVEMQDNLVPTTGDAPTGANGRTNGKSHAIAPEIGAPLATSASAAGEGDSPFARRLDPFPPASDSTGMWL